MNEAFEEQKFKPGEPQDRRPRIGRTTCQMCLETFEYETTASRMPTYCSPQCRERAKYYRKQARKKGLSVSEATPGGQIRTQTAVERHNRAEERKVKLAERKSLTAERSLALLKEARELADMSDLAHRELVQKVISKVVLEHMSTAMQVLAGEKRWDSQQAMVFKALLNKMVPDARAEDVKREKLSKGARQRFAEMSLDELEAALAEHIGGSVVNDPESPESSGSDDQEEQDDERE